MPKLTGSKEEIQGRPNLPEGLYTVRLDGFKPRHSKNKDSVNLQPQMKIINHPEHNSRQIFDNLNTNAKFLWPDFCHCFGVPLESDTNFPGDFIGPDDNPEQWQYTGPLLGQTGQIYVVESDNGKGGRNNKIRFYVCKLPNCEHKHSKQLN
jgi:hypothetical protein